MAITAGAIETPAVDGPFPVGEHLVTEVLTRSSEDAFRVRLPDASEPRNLGGMCPAVNTEGAIVRDVG